MSEVDRQTSSTSPGRWYGLLALLGLGVALLHLAPYWDGARNTPEGWQYTWVLSGSPDYLQYRVFERQSLVDGPIVRNTMTLEPNSPHIPVFFYWGLARTGRALGTTAEHVYPYAGALFAFLMVLLIGVLVRRFTPAGAARWWVVAVILFGGGFGGLLRWIEISPIAVGHPTVRGLLRNAISHGFFENIRGNYLLYALTEAHYLLVWLLTTTAVFAYYLALARPAVWRTIVAGILTGAIVFLHIYEGVLLALVFLLTALLCAPRSSSPRTTRLVGGVCAAVSLLCLVAVALLMRSGGLPGPPLDAVTVLLGVVVAAYPLAWLVLGLGFREYWAASGFAERFLVGWAAACVLLTLSGPFYPFPNRGSMTMGIPLYLMAGTIAWRRWGQVRWPMVLVILALAAPTPVWLVTRQMTLGGFRGDQPYKHLSPDNLRILDALRARNTANDVLLVDKHLPDWDTDDLWLVAEYHGRYFPGHGFLTPEYERKRADGNRFYEERDPAARQRFLDEQGITLVFAADSLVPSLSQVPDLRPLAASGAGTLFTYGRAAAR